MCHNNSSNDLNMHLKDLLAGARILLSAAFGAEKRGGVKLVRERSIHVALGKRRGKKWGKRKLNWIAEFHHQSQIEYLDFHIGWILDFESVGLLLIHFHISLCGYVKVQWCFKSSVV